MNFIFARSASYDAWLPRALGFLRIIAALLILERGMSKLFGFPHVAAFDGLSRLSLTGLAGLIEAVCGGLILIGLFTRPAALIMSTKMAFAYITQHASAAVFPVQNGGDAAILYCVLLLYLVVAGSGAWGLDRTIGRQRTTSHTT